MAEELKHWDNPASELHRRSKRSSPTGQDRGGRTSSSRSPESGVL